MAEQDGVVGYVRASEVAEDERGPGLVTVMEHEATIPGLDARRRCAMVKDF